MMVIVICTDDNPFDNPDFIWPVSIAVALPARAERALKICSRGRDGRQKQ